jgi:hypothetical protein
MTWIRKKFQIKSSLRHTSSECTDSPTFKEGTFVIAFEVEEFDKVLEGEGDGEVESDLFTFCWFCCQSLLR